MIGGIGIVAGATAAFPFLPTPGEHLPLLVAMGLLLVVGVLDDRHDIRKRVRVITQVVAALLMIYWGDIRIDSLGNLFGLGELRLGALSVPFTVFATVGVINAVNMTDGLAGGLSIVSLGLLAAIAAIFGRGADAAMMSAIICAISGFLLFNYRFPGRTRARAFMGDAGSTVLGFVLVWFCASLSQGSQAVMPPVLAAWLLAIPLLDTLSVMARRVMNGDSPFKPDRRHLHHILLAEGRGVRSTVNLIVLAAATVALVAVATWQLRAGAESLLLVGFIGLAWVYWDWCQKRIEAASHEAALARHTAPSVAQIEASSAEEFQSKAA